MFQHAQFDYNEINQALGDGKPLDLSPLRLMPRGRLPRFIPLTCPAEVNTNSIKSMIARIKKDDPDSPDCPEPNVNDTPKKARAPRKTAAAKGTTDGNAIDAGAESTTSTSKAKRAPSAKKAPAKRKNGAAKDGAVEDRGDDGASPAKRTRKSPARKVKVEVNEDEDDEEGNVA